MWLKRRSTRARQSIATKKNRRPRAKNCRRLWLEPLEDRTLLSTVFDYQYLGSHFKDMVDSNLTPTLDNKLSSASNNAIPFLGHQLNNFSTVLHPLDQIGTALEGIQSSGDNGNPTSAIQNAANSAFANSNPRVSVTVQPVTGSSPNFTILMLVHEDPDVDVSGLAPNVDFSAISNFLNVKGTNTPLRISAGFDFQLQMDYTDKSSLTLGNPQLQGVTANVPLIVTVNAQSGNQAFSFSGILNQLLTATATDHNNNASFFHGYFGVTPDQNGNVTNVVLTNNPNNITQNSEANLDADLDAKFGSGQLPFNLEVTTELNLHWMFNNESLLPSNTPAGNFGTIQNVHFGSVNLDVGTFLTGFVSPVIKKVQAFTEPFEPIVHVLNSDIPGLSAIGIHVSMASVLGIGKVIGLIDGINTFNPNTSAVSPTIFLGGFGLSDGGSGGNSPGDLNDGSFNVEALDMNDPDSNTIKSAANQATGSLFDTLRQVFGSNLHFPIVEGSEDVFHLLEGPSQPATLFQYQASFNFPPINIGIPLGSIGVISLFLTGDFSLGANLDVGYNTAGLAKFVQDGNGDTNDLLHGFFINVNDTNLNLHAGLGITASAIIVSATGGINGDVKFSLSGAQYGADSNGNIYLDNPTLLDTVEHDPLCLFRVDGKVTFDLSVEVGFDVGFVHVTLFGPYTMASIPLIDFSSQCGGTGGQHNPSIIYVNPQEPGHTVHIHRFVERLPAATDKFSGIEVDNGGTITRYVDTEIPSDGSSPYPTDPGHPITGIAVEVYGSGTVIIDSGITQDAVVDGYGPPPANAGDDFEYYGSGQAVLLGGTGNNILIGGTWEFGGGLPKGFDGNQLPALAQPYLTYVNSSGQRVGFAGLQLVHGDGNDLLIGTTGPDHIYGGTGNNEMEGLGGGDFLYGPGSGGDRPVDAPGPVGRCVFKESAAALFMGPDGQIHRDTGVDQSIDTIFGGGGDNYLEYDGVVPALSAGPFDNVTVSGGFFQGVVIKESGKEVRADIDYLSIGIQQGTVTLNDLSATALKSVDITVANNNGPVADTVTVHGRDGQIDNWTISASSDGVSLDNRHLDSTTNQYVNDSPPVSVKGLNGDDTVILDQGNGGNQTTFQGSTPAAITINTGNGLNDLVTINPELSSLDTLRNKITVNGGTGNDTLQVFDRFDFAFSTWNISGSRLVHSTLLPPGEAEIDYSNLTSLIVSGGFGGSEFNITKDSKNLDEMPLHLTLDPFASVIDFLNIYDDYNPTRETWTVKANEIDRDPGFALPVHTISFTKPLHSLVLNGGSGTNSANTLGNDFNLVPADGTSDGNLDLLPPLLTINGQGLDRISADDSNLNKELADDLEWDLAGTYFRRSYTVFGEDQNGNPTRTVYTATVQYSNIAGLHLITDGAFQSVVLSPDSHNLDELPGTVQFDCPPVVDGFEVVAYDQNNGPHFDLQTNAELPTNWTVTGQSYGRTSISRAYLPATERDIVVPAMRQLTIYGGTSTNHFLVQTKEFIPDLPADLIVNGGPGTNSLKVDDSQSINFQTTFDIHASSVHRHYDTQPSTGPFDNDIQFSNVAALEVDVGLGQTVNVRDTAANVATTIAGPTSGSFNDNFFNIGEASQILGPITIHGSPGNSDTWLSRAAFLQEFPIRAGGRPTSITSGPDGALSFTENGANRIGRIMPDGTYSDFPIPPAASFGINGPDNIVVGPNQKLWFIENHAQIDEMDLSGNVVGQFNPVPPGATSAYVDDLITGGDGYLWFTETDSSSSAFNIGRMTTGGDRLPYFTLPRAGEGAYDLTLGPDGQNVWFVERGQSNYLAEISPQVAIRDWSIPNNIFINSLTAGPDGNVWAAAYDNNGPGGEILRFTFTNGLLTTSVFKPLNGGVVPRKILLGPENLLWFTDAGTNQIGVVTPSGFVGGVPIPTPNSDPIGITNGPDGSLWFTELGTGQIGRIPIAQQVSQWQITGPGSGSLYGNVQFDFIHTIVGGFGGDTYQFVGPNAGLLAEPGEPISGLLFGGFGPQTLDLSQAPGVTVTKSSAPGTFHGFQGTASNLGKGFDNIDTIITNTAQGVKLDDTANTMPTIWTISSTSVTRQVQGQAASTTSLGSLISLEIDAGSGGNTFNILSTALGVPFTINGGSGGDAYHFGDPTHPLTDLKGPMTLNPGIGVNSMMVDASGTGIPVNATLDLLSPLITQIGFPALDASSKDVAKMTVHIGADVSLAGGVQFNTGANSDTVNLQGLPTNAPFTLTGTGQGSLTIGGADGLDDIGSNVTISAPAILTLNDQPDRLPTIYTITGSSLMFAHPSTITASTSGLRINMPSGPPSSVTIFGGSGGNRFLMPNGPPNFPNGTAVHGGGSADSLTITQPTDPTQPPWIITATSVFVPNLSLPPLASGPGGATVTYDGLGSLVLNGPKGSTAFDVLSTAAGTATTINSAGTDTVTVGNNGSVQGILGPLSIDPANVSLVVDDSADPTPRTVTLTSTQIIGLSPAVINYDSGVSNLTVDGGFGGNTFDVVNTSASAVTNVNSGAGNDFVNVLGVSNFLYIDGVAGGDVVTIGSLSSDAVSVSSAEDGHATSSPAGADSLANIQGPVIIHNSSGQTALIVDESRVTAPVRPVGFTLVSSDLDLVVPATGNGGIYYNRTGQVTSLTYFGPQVASSYIVYSTNGIPNTYLNLGPGNDTVDILATIGPLTINGGGGNDIVTIGGQFPIHGGGVSEIGPSIVLRNPTGTMALTVDDSNVSNTLDGLPNTMSRNATITGTSITGMPAGTTIDYTNANLTSLTILGGAGGNTFDVKNTPAGAVTTLDSGNGVDTVYVEGTTGPLTVNTQQSSTGPGFGGFEAVYVGKFTASGFTLDGIQGALTVNTLARPGIDYGNLALYDTGATASENYTLTNNTILRSGAAPIYYTVTNQLFFFLGSGGNTFNVQSTHPALAYSIFGGVGNDIFNIGDANGTLNGIFYQLAISIQNPGSQVILHDEGTSANYGYALASVILHPTIAINLPAYRILRSDWNQQGLGTAIWVTGPLYGTPPLPLQSLVLKAGSGNNTFNIQSLPPGNPTVTLDGGGGSNTLQGPNQNNVWQITSPNAGSLDTNIRFGNIQNLIGGTANDVFAIRKDPFLRIGGSLSGKIDGGGGSDLLDYSGYTGDVTVNMRLGSATGVAGGISNIQNVTGSQGNDLLVGDANANVFVGGTGRNIIIGGAGPDQITGGGGDNILIGGTTVWDANPAALQAIMQEWTNTSLTFDQRVNALRKGITVGGKTYALNTSTVIKDSSPDSLIGGGGQNWFFFDFDDIINNGAGPGPNDRTTKV